MSIQGEPVATLIYTVNAKGPSSFDKVTYSLTDTKNQPVRDLSIDPSSGIIATSRIFNYDVEQAYPVRIQLQMHVFTFDLFKTPTKVIMHIDHCLNISVKLQIYLNVVLPI